MLERGLEVVFDSWFQCALSVGWSPQTFDEIFLPLIKETVDLAHAFDAVFVFYDAGKMADVIPRLIDAGVDVISGLQPPPVGDVALQEVKARYGDRVALMGGIDPCYVFDIGSPERATDAVRQAIADAGPGGGYILGTALSPAPETTEACLRAAGQAVRDYGVYGRDL
jgi:uroporphyrinogen decarboxylase